MNKKDTAQHTPTPWRYCPTNNGHMIAGARPGYLAEIRDCGSGNVAENGRFIVRACNAHDELVAALRKLELRARALDQSATHDGLLNCDALAQARAALAKAIPQHTLAAG